MMTSRRRWRTGEVVSEEKDGETGLNHLFDDRGTAGEGGRDE